MTETHDDADQLILPLEQVWTPPDLDLGSYGAGKLMLAKDRVYPPPSFGVHIDWARWGVGAIHHRGCFCVLGHLALASGVPEAVLRDRTTLTALPPHQLSKLPRFLWDPHASCSALPELSTPELWRMMLSSLNDDGTQHPAWRAEALTRLLAVQGVNLTWGGYESTRWKQTWRPRPWPAAGLAAGPLEGS